MKRNFLLALLCLIVSVSAYSQGGIKLNEIEAIDSNQIVITKDVNGTVEQVYKPIAYLFDSTGITYVNFIAGTVNPDALNVFYNDGSSIVLPYDSDSTNEIELPAGGQVGQVLVIDQFFNVSWQDPEDELPPIGSEGQILKVVPSGTIAGNVLQYVDDVGGDFETYNSDDTLTQDRTVTMGTHKIDFDGNIQLSDYGTNNNTGALSRLLGVETNGSVIEVDPDGEGYRSNIYNNDGAIPGGTTRVISSGNNNSNLSILGNSFNLNAGNPSLSMRPDQNGGGQSRFDLYNGNSESMTLLFNNASLFWNVDRSLVWRNKNDGNKTAHQLTNDGDRIFYTQSGVSNAIWNSANSRFGIGTITPSNTLDVDGDTRLRGELNDVNNDSGTSGQILSTTGTGIDWIDPPSNTDNYIIGASTLGSTNKTYTLDMLTGPDVTFNVTDLYEPNTDTQLSQEQVQDFVSTMLVAGADLSATYNDSANTFTFDYTGTSGGADGVVTGITETPNSSLGVNRLWTFARSNGLPAIQYVYKDLTAWSTFVQTGGVTNIIPAVTNQSNVQFGLGVSDPTDMFDLNGAARLRGQVKDGNNSAGIAGQVLSTTGTGVDWVNVSGDIETAQLNNPTGTLSTSTTAWSVLNWASSGSSTNISASSSNDSFTNTTGGSIQVNLSAMLKFSGDVGSKIDIGIFINNSTNPFREYRYYMNMNTDNAFALNAIVNVGSGQTLNLKSRQTSTSSANRVDTLDDDSTFYVQRNN